MPLNVSNGQRFASAIFNTKLALIRTRVRRITLDILNVLRPLLVERQRIEVLQRRFQRCVRVPNVPQPFSVRTVDRHSTRHQVQFSPSECDDVIRRAPVSSSREQQTKQGGYRIDQARGPPHRQVAGGLFYPLYPSEGGGTIHAISALERILGGKGVFHYTLLAKWTPCKSGSSRRRRM